MGCAVSAGRLSSGGRGGGGGGKSGDESGMLFDWETEWNAIGGKAHCEIVKRYI